MKIHVKNTDDAMTFSSFDFEKILRKCLTQQGLWSLDLDKMVTMRHRFSLDQLTG